MSEESLVTLQVPADYEGEVTTAPWLTVAQEQLSYDDEYFDSRLEDGELLALLFLDDYHTRKLVRRFVLIDDERVLIFDESGRRIATLMPALSTVKGSSTATRAGSRSFTAV